MQYYDPYSKDREFENDNKSFRKLIFSEAFVFL